MGLSDTFKAAAQTAFVVFDDVTETVTYRSKSSASAAYDPDTGTVTDAYTDYSVKMILNNSISDSIFAKGDRQFDNESILKGDAFFIIPVDNLTPTPQLHDQILRAAGNETWDIIWFETDAAAAVYKFQLRKL